MEPKLLAAQGPARSRGADAQAAVTALYQAHAVGLIRLAVVMLGDRHASEDVVQDAFAGLYRRWSHLDGDRALGYVRASVLNGCRSRLRARARDERLATASQATMPAASAEYACGARPAAGGKPMNALEDRIRAAASAVAATVADGSAPPLRLPQPGRRPGLRGWDGLPSWVVPFAAAAAVIVIVAASILVARAVVPEQTVPGTGPALAAPLPLTAGGLPAYFLAIPPGDQQAGAEPGNQNEGVGAIPRRLSSHETLRVVATDTGRTVATATLPGYVTEIAASRGAFFAAAVRGGAATFFEIRLNGDRTTTTVTELPIQPDTAPLEFMAASPNGSKLAYSTLVMHGATGDVQNLVAASTSNGSEHEWTTPARYSTGSMGPMNFLADGRTLAFSWTGPSGTSPSSALRLLDTAAPGGDLMAGRAVLRFANRPGMAEGYTLSPNGRFAVGVASGRPYQAVAYSMVVSSAGTRKGAVLYRPKETGADSVNSCNTPPLWISNTGSQVLIECYATASPEVRIVLINHGHVTALPWLDATANEVTAFPGITAIGMPANANG